MPEFRAPRDWLVEHGASLDEDYRQEHNRQQHWKETGSSLGSIVAGGALAVYGATRRSRGGAAMAAAGGLLVISGIRQAARPEVVHVERAITINRPIEQVYHFFRVLENLPSFMRHLKQVRITSERTSHWVARAPLGLDVEWDAEVVAEERNSFLIWQSLPGTVVPNRGSVEFTPSSQYHGGTEVFVAMDYSPLAGRGGALFARVFGRDPGVQLREDLRRLKQLLEAGEVPTTEGQTHGRRSAFVRMAHGDHDEAQMREFLRRQLA